MRFIKNSEKIKAALEGRGLYPIFFGQGDLFFGSPLRGVGELSLPDPNTIGWTHPSLQEKLLYKEHT